MIKEVVIVSAVRTPIGRFGGALSTVSAPQLGAVAIKGALERAGVAGELVDEVYMGCVLQAGMGQAPARQAARFAGLTHDFPATTVNKVCASGMKSIMLAAQAIQCGDADIVVAGGMENMSQVPHLMLQGRNGQKLGNISMEDGLLKDGLTDVYNQQHMGLCAELCADTHEFTREEQDAFAMESYKRSEAAWNSNKFDQEVIPVPVPQRRGEPVIVDKDEEYTAVKFDKIPGLRPVFKKDGSVTAANASTLNDGAAALLMMSADKAAELGLKPLAKLMSYADAAQEPEWFTTAPAKALPKAMAKAGVSKDDVDYWELNEAFSVVGLANIKLLDIPADKTNVHGGAVSLGHPLGCSGARIVVTLLNVLQKNDAKIGAAGICNGGGGASALLIEKL